MALSVDFHNNFDCLVQLHFVLGFDEEDFFIFVDGLNLHQKVIFISIVDNFYLLFLLQGHWFEAADSFVLEKHVFYAFGLLVEGVFKLHYFVEGTTEQHFPRL